VESIVVPRSEQHREIASDLFYGGTVLPNDAALHPGLYHAGLLRRVEEAGGVVLGLTPVESIREERPGFRIGTSCGDVVAKDVIVATNGYTQRVHGHLDQRIVPVGSAVIATEPLPPGLIQQLMPGGRMYGNTNRVFSYFRAAPDQDRIVWGGRVGRGFAADSPFAFAHLARDMRRTFPQLGDVRVTHGWSGQIGYTFDSLPHLGRTPDGIHYAMGYCGTGVSRSTWFGHKIALKLLGDPDGATAFDDIVFPTHPFHAVAPAMVPVYEAWYRMRDALDF
jgi:glycine/D-amino acid oxidase-like deaminating enzyme